MEKKLRTDLPAEEVLRRLQANTVKPCFLPDVRASFFYGTMEQDRFTLYENDGITNCFRAILRGTVQPSGGESLLSIDVTISPHSKWMLLSADVLALLGVVLTLVFGLTPESLPMLLIPIVLVVIFHRLRTIMFCRSAGESVQRLCSLLDAVIVE